MDDGSRILVGSIIIVADLLLTGALCTCRFAAMEGGGRYRSDSEDRAARRAEAAFSALRMLSVLIAALSLSVNILPAVRAALPGMAAGIAASAALWLLAAVLYLTAAELLPRRIGGGFSASTAADTVVRAVDILFLPLTALAGALSAGIGRIFGLSRGRQDTVTEEDILQLVDAGNENGVIEESQREMINNIFEFGDLTAEDVMTHRTNISAAALSDGLGSVLRIAIDDGYSRIPIYDGSIDSIVGVVYVKDLLCLVGCESIGDFSVASFMRDVIYVPESCKCETLFRRFTREGSQLAVALDEYGGTAGIVTMEDLLESIVGSIRDEYDEEREELTQVSDGVYTVDGMAEPEEIFTRLGIELPADSDYDTMGGFLIDLLGRIPAEGEMPSVRYKNAEFTVLLTEDRRISKIKVCIDASTEETTEQEKEEEHR